MTQHLSWTRKGTFKGGGWIKSRRETTRALSNDELRACHMPKELENQLLDYYLVHLPMKSIRSANLRHFKTIRHYQLCTKVDCNCTTGMGPSLAN